MLLLWMIPKGIHTDKCDTCKAGREIIRTRAEKEAQVKNLGSRPQEKQEGNPEGRFRSEDHRWGSRRHQY